MPNLSPQQLQGLTLSGISNPYEGLDADITEQFPDLFGIAGGSLASLATGSAAINPAGILAYYGISLGLSALSNVLNPTRRRLEYLESGLTFDAERPSRRIFGNAHRVNGWLLGAFERTRLFTGSRSGRAQRVYGTYQQNQLLPRFARFEELKGENYQLLDMVLWLAEGEMTSLDGIYFGNEYLPLHQQANVQVSVGEGEDSVAAPITTKYYLPPATQGRFRNRFYVSTNFATDTTNTELMGRYPDQWNEINKAAGHSWAVVTLIDADDILFTGVPEFSFDLKGQAVTDMTNPSRLVYTDNVAAIQHWILSHWVEGIDSANVDLRAFQDAYMWARRVRNNDYQQYQRLAPIKPLPAQSTQLFSRYPSKTKLGAFHGVVESETPLNELNRRFNNIRKGTTFVDFGKIKVTVGENLDYSQAVVITDNDLAGPVTINAKPNPSVTFNTVRATIPLSQPDGYVRTELEVTDSDLLAKDNGRVRVRDIGDLDGVTDKMQAQRILIQQARTMRHAVGYEIPCKPIEELLRLRHNDAVILNIEKQRLRGIPIRAVRPTIDEPTGRLNISGRWSPPTEYANETHLPPLVTRHYNEAFALPPGNISITSVIKVTRQRDIADTTITYDTDRFYPTTECLYRIVGETTWRSLTFTNTRDTTQRHLIDVLVEDTDYMFKFRNVARDGSVSLYSALIAHNPSHDTTAPPAPSGVVATGIVQGVYLERTPVDLSAVPDYAHTVAEITYTPTGGAEKSVEKEFAGSDASFILTDTGKNERIDLSIVVKDVDRSGNKSAGATVTATTESAEDLVNLFQNFPIGARFTYNDYQQRTPAEVPADAWDGGSWYYHNNPPPTPASVGPPITRALFESFGVSGQGSDAIVLNPTDSGGLSLVDFADANSERLARRAGREQFPKFRNTLVKIGVQGFPNYFGIARIRLLRYTLDDGTVATIWFAASWVHTSFEAPYPPFGAVAGQPILTFDFQLARGGQGEPGKQGDTTERVYKLRHADQAKSAPPDNTRHFMEVPTPSDGWGSRRLTTSPDFPILEGNERTVPGDAKVGDAPNADYGNWGETFIVEEFGKSGGDVEFAFARARLRQPPEATNPDDRSLDNQRPQGFTATPTGVSLNFETGLFYEFYYIRRKDQGTIYNRLWGDWSEGALLNEQIVPAQEFWTLAPRGYPLVEWSYWRRYDRHDRENNIETTIPDSSLGSWVAGDEGNTLPPAPGKQYYNNPTVPGLIVSGAVKRSTPPGSIEETSKLFRLRNRYRKTDDDEWLMSAITARGGGHSGRWNYGNPLESHYRIAATHKDWELVCVFREWNPDEGAYFPFGPVHTCGIVDPGAYLPTGGKEGEVCIIIDGAPRWKKLGIEDVAGLISLDTGAYNIEATAVTRHSMRIEIVKAPATGQYTLRYRVLSDADPDGTNEIGWTTKPAQASEIFPLSGLKTATTYQIQAKRGTGDWSRTFTRTTQQQATVTPTAPVLTGKLEVRAGSLSHNGLILDWTYPEGSFQRFQIWQDGVLIDTTTYNTYNLIGDLVADTEYTFTVYAENEGVLSNGLSKTQRTPALTGVAAPQWQSGDLVEITLDRDTRISTVTWTARAKAGETYEVIYGAGSVSAEGVINIAEPTNLVLDHTQTSITVAPQAADWVAAVRIHNAGGHSAYRHSVATASALTGVPVMRGIEIVWRYANSFRIAWDHATGFARNRIKYYYAVSETVGVDGEAIYPADTEFTGQTIHDKLYKTFTPTTPGATQFVRIRAKGILENNALTRYSTAREIVVDLPDVQENLLEWDTDDLDSALALSATYNSITASWPNVKGYPDNFTRFQWRLFQGTSTGFFRTHFKTGNIYLLRGRPITPTQITIGDLPSTTSRRWRMTVQAFNARGRGGPIISGTTTLPQVNLAPQWGNFSITNISTTHNSITFRFPAATVGSGAISYTAQAHTSGNFSPSRNIKVGTVTEVSTGVLSATFTGLEASTGYHVRVIATANNNSITRGRADAIRTSAAPVNAPSFPERQRRVTFSQVSQNHFRVLYAQATAAAGSTVTRYRYELRIPDEDEAAGYRAVTGYRTPRDRNFNVPGDVATVETADITADTLFTVWVWAEASNGTESEPIKGTVRTLADTTIGKPTWPDGVPTLARNSADPFNSLIFSWPAATDATKYRYRYSTDYFFTDDNVSDVVEVVGTETSVTITGLTAQTTYWAEVAVGNDAGYLEYRRTAAAGVATDTPTVTPDLPGIPNRNLTLSVDPNTLAIKIDWEPATGVVSNYEIRRATSLLGVLATANPNQYESDDQIFPPQTSYTWTTDVAEDTEYYFVVLVHNAAGVNRYNANFIRTPVASPTFPSSARLSISAIHSTGFYASWGAADRADSYDLGIYLLGNPLPIKTYTDLTTLSQNVTGLDANKNTRRNYIVLVRAKNARGFSNNNLRSPVNLPAAPTRVPVSRRASVTLDPNSFTPSVGPKTGFRIDWTFTNDPPNIQNYDVGISLTHDTGTWTTERVRNDVTHYVFSGLSREIVNPDNGNVQYNVRVRAVNDAGEGNWVPNDAGLTVTLDDE